MRSVAVAAPVLVAASLAGCVKYHAHPLEAVASEQQFRARSLADPGLRAFLNRANWPPDKLALNDLEAVAVYFSPDLDVARAQLRTAQAAIISAGARPNPGLSTEAGYETDPESHLLFNFFPSITVVTAGKRSWRVLEAEKTADAARVAVEETVWRVRSRVRTAWLDHLFALRARDVLRRESSLRSEVVEMLDKRVAVGEAAQPEAAAARSALIAVDVAARAAEAQVSETGAALATAAGLPELPAIDTQALPPAPPSPALAEVQKAGLLNRADIRRGLLEYAAADAALHLEIANQYPDFQYSPGYSFNEGFHQFTLGSSFNVPLMNRNRGPIAEAEAKRSEAETRFKALQAQAIGAMQLALASYRGAQSELETAEDTYVRLQQMREVAMERAVRQGDQDRLALAAVRLDGVAAARAQLDALRRVETALAALEDALQHSLEAGPPVPDPMRKT